MRKTPSHHNPGFIRFYYKLVNDMNGGFGFRMLLWSPAATVLCLYLFLLVLGLATHNIKLPTFSIMVNSFIAYLLLAAMVYLTTLAIWANRDEVRLAEEVARYLLLEADCPYDDIQGLSHSDLSRLKGIAQAEQNSAEWRGGFLISSIVGIGIAIIAGNVILNISDDWFRSFLRNFPGQAPQTVMMFTLIMMAIAIIVALGFGRWFQRYMFAEFPNRVLLFACEEAEGILDAFGVPVHRSPNLSERQAIASHFGLELMPLPSDLSPDQRKLTTIVQVRTTNSDGYSESGSSVEYRLRLSENKSVSPLDWRQSLQKMITAVRRKLTIVRQWSVGVAKRSIENTHGLAQRIMAQVEKISRTKPRP